MLLCCDSKHHGHIQCVLVLTCDDIVCIFCRVQKDIVSLYGNNPSKESNILNMAVIDIGLPPWADRVYQPYHQMALSFKREFIPILDKRCCLEAHAAFRRYSMKRLNETEIAKRDHGFHCSLYDAYELYLSYISE